MPRQARRTRVSTERVRSDFGPPGSRCATVSTIPYRAQGTLCPHRARSILPADSRTIRSPTSRTIRSANLLDLRPEHLLAPHDLPDEQPEPARVLVDEVEVRLERALDAVAVGMFTIGNVKVIPNVSGTFHRARRRRLHANL